MATRPRRPAASDVSPERQCPCVRHRVDLWLRAFKAAVPVETCRIGGTHALSRYRSRIRECPTCVWRRRPDDSWDGAPCESWWPPRARLLDGIPLQRCRQAALYGRRGLTATETATQSRL